MVDGKEENREVVYTLSVVQRLQVMALVKQRQELITQTNRIMSQIEEALKDLASSYARLAGAPATTRGYELEQRGEDIVVLAPLPVFKQGGSNEPANGDVENSEPTPPDEGVAAAPSQPDGATDSAGSKAVPASN